MSNASDPDPSPPANGFSPAPPHSDSPHKISQPYFANGFSPNRNPPDPYANAFSTMTREKEGTNTIKCEKRLKKVLQLCEECVKI